MSTPTNSALHMMEGRPSVPLAVSVAISAYGDARADDDGTSAARLGECINEIRNAMAAAVAKTALSHFADEVEASGEAEKQTQLALLAECRSHLPLAAASWNDDEDRTVANFHVNRILDLIKRVDAALSKVQQP